MIPKLPEADADGEDGEDGEDEGRLGSFTKPSKLLTLPKETQGEQSNAGILKCIRTIKDDAMTGGSVVDEVGDEVAYFSVFSLF